VFAQVELDSGAVASLSTAYLAPSTSPFEVSDRLDVYGSGGVASVDLTLPSVLVQGARVATPDALLAPEHGPGALSAELAHFCAAVRSGSATTDVPVADAVEGVRIAHAVVVSAGAGGRVVELAGPEGGL
jgi:predicted dehydrogenase